MLLGGAAAWPFAARAQQGERCGASACSCLDSRTIRRDKPASPLFAALQELGGARAATRKSIPLVRRQCRGLRKYAAELVALAAGRHPLQWHPSRGGIATGDPHRADRVQPVADPVGAGFVESLARPGGNATGFISHEYVEWQMAGVAQRNRSSMTRAAVLRIPP